MPSPHTNQAKWVTFAELWAAYPKEDPCVDKNGKPPKGWENQCAIRVGLALERVGVSFRSFGGARCPTGPQRGGMAAGAQALANWLRARPFPGCPLATHVAPANWKDAVEARTGIIFFKDYWRRSGETSGTGTGDHIDLWNRDTLTPSFVSFLRFTLGIDRLPNLNIFTRAPDNENWFSNLEKSKEIWFWEMA